MDLFLLPLNHLVPFWVSAAVAGAILFVALRAAMSAEGRPSGWVRAITSPSSKILFALLFVAWAVVSGIVLGLVVPHEGADSPYGGFALISLFVGFFIMMGFLWSVIGE